MSEPVKIEKTIYSLQDFNNAVDTNFKQLIRTQPTTVNPPESIDQSITDFFEQYNALFFDIPLSGSDESHLELATRSLEYLGVSLDDLTTEISNLREENIELKNQILLSSQIDVGTQI
jgi:hypothetical protein